ncbi:hypothetical protein J4460_04810 [Candidatus Woesearchaeota archaeon]|nr:hypothetical protein [Candidatus Woesearchaeota archaeon]HIH37376.1 hypothetical protein [Candidatus Woesearchaeota archaeon]HIH48403.1 hypothetical protein [Candidatus Woesearchaeota archaeon]HIJ04216.1 hypothetical protein [Candidatus Woesearchaeota archaeon]
MKEALLFCWPGETYRGLPEVEVARRYSHMAIYEFDQLVCFHECYERWKKTPDYTADIGIKQGRAIGLALFARQPVVRIGEDSSTLTSSSYLFNPAGNHSDGGEELHDGDIFLPDLDVVTFLGGEGIMKAAAQIQQFYGSSGWQTQMFEEGFLRKVRIEPQTTRFTSGFDIYDPTALLAMASTLPGYSIDTLCFDAE